MEKKKVIGIDLGGTKILGVLADEKGVVLAETKEATPKTSEEIIRTLVGIIDKLLSCAGEKEKVLSIGLAVAGQINFKEGKVVSSPNLSLKEIPLSRIIQERFSMKVFVDHDANAAALGEKYFGIAKGIDDFICLTLGTGIGGGIVARGKIYRGSQGYAGEVGHMVLDINGPPCFCGNRGCFEVLASGKAVARLAKEKINEQSLIFKLAGGNSANITGEMVTEAALREDKLAMDILKDIGKIIGTGIANLINLFNPQMVILTGGMAQAGELILAPAKEEARARTIPASFKKVEIVLGALGEKSGALGACALVLEEAN